MHRPIHSSNCPAPTHVYLNGPPLERFPGCLDFSFSCSIVFLLFSRTRRRRTRRPVLSFASYCQRQPPASKNEWRTQQRQITRRAPDRDAASKAYRCFVEAACSKLDCWAVKRATFILFPPRPRRYHRDYRDDYNDDCEPGSLDRHEHEHSIPLLGRSRRARHATTRMPTRSLTVLPPPQLPLPIPALRGLRARVLPR